MRTALARMAAPAAPRRYTRERGKEIIRLQCAGDTLWGECGSCCRCRRHVLQRVQVTAAPWKRAVPSEIGCVSRPHCVGETLRTAPLQGLARLAVWHVRAGAAAPAGGGQAPGGRAAAELRTPAAALPRTPSAAASPGGGLLSKRCAQGQGNLHPTP